MPSWQRIARRIRVPLGFVFAAVYLFLARPSPESLAVGTVFAIVGLVIRALASGHVRKNQELTTTGPYARTRNPLYLGSFVMAAGFVVASKSWIVAGIAVVLLVSIYIPVIRGEENFLRSQFPEFEAYAREVPRFLPRLSAFQSSPHSFDWHLYSKHREYNAAVGAILMFAGLILKAHFFPQ
jgi:protein-S-isoprenylcysteine O-methyltransferase Ste14